MQQITPQQAAALRLRHALTQEQIAPIYGVSKKTVSSWERGETQIPLAYYGWVAFCLVDDVGMELAREASL